MEIRGTAAIVTGGASGLGAATAQLLAAKGAKVTILDASVEAGEKLASEIGGRFAKVDVRDEGSVDAALAAAAAAHGVARVLVNCAGIAVGARTVGRDGAPHALDLWRKVIEINLVGSFCVLSRFAARLAAAEPIGEERGVAINTASVAAYDGQVGQTAYSASKGGVVGMTLPAARDLAPLGIRVMTIAPGIFWTPMLGGMSDAVRDSLIAQAVHPKRLGKPEEYALLVESIVTNPMLNGEVIRLDGAVRLPPK